MAKRKPSGRAFTVPSLEPPPVERHGEHWWLEIDGRRLRLSNLDKVFWPAEGYTKGDLISYYHAVAPAMLPYLADRPLTMKRMPDGIDGPFFYEKEAPSHTPDWIRRCAVEHETSEGGWSGWSRKARPVRRRSEDGKSIVRYLMAGDAASLLFVANLGCIEFHPLHSRCGSIDTPDYLFFDLDPFEPATFDDVRTVALHVRAATEALGLPSYPKTSGATGMQIYVPIKTGPSHGQVRAVVEAIGRAILQADPARVTMEWEISKRTGKVFIDHNMNRRGANIAAAYCVRPEPGATVSTPLTWDEVAAGVHPTDFTIATVPHRIATSGDSFRGVIEKPIDLVPLLKQLGLDAAEEEPGAPGPAPPTDALETYKRKRRFEETPEPPPAEATTTALGNSFVIQKHNATRLHYDLRLERDGVLVSWAVPKGLPVVPGVKHLAVQTEDHPLEYGTFEGGIPDGNYGAGEVKIFDSGTYDAPEWEDGKLTFCLHGRRYRGEYHMVRTQRSDWIVFLSKRSAADVPAAPPAYSPMLAEAGHDAFDDPRWRFEAKLDGVRTLAYIGTDGTKLFSRTGRDQTAQYPELNNLAQWVNALHAVVDGEIVAHDAQGRPSFSQLQQRINLSGERDVARARRSVPVTMYAFDLLWFDGEDLTARPIEERRERLEEIVTESGRLRLTLYVDQDGVAFFDAAKRLGLEGMMAKRLGSPYTSGRRSRDWRKIKATRSRDCVILGWTPGSGGRAHTLGALVLGAYAGGELCWLGQVGTGFTDAMLEGLLEKLKTIERPEPAVDDPALRALKGAHWVAPVLVCDVEYLEITEGRKLRAPSFKGLRPDKLPSDCVLSEPG